MTRATKLLLAMLASSATCAAPVAPQPAAGPASVIEQLVHLPHGLQAGSAEQAQPLLEKIRRDPKPYIELLVARLQPDRVATDADSARQAEIATALLVRAGGEAGRDAAARQFATLSAAAQQRRASFAATHPKDEQGRAALIEQSARAGHMTVVARSIVREFSDARDTRLRDVLLDRFPTEDYSSQLVYLQYFTTATPKDPKVQNLLRSLYDSPRSGFYRAPGIGALLGEPRDRKPP